MKERQRRRWLQQHPYYNRQNAYYLLPREGQVIIVRLRTGGPNTRTIPTALLTPSASKAADMAHLCVPQNQALGVCRGFVPHSRERGSSQRSHHIKHRRRIRPLQTQTSHANQASNWTFCCVPLWHISRDSRACAAQLSEPPQPLSRDLGPVSWRSATVK